MPPARRIAVVTLVAVLAGGALLATLPGSLSTVRLAGVGLLWWYVAIAAPVVAAAGVLTALARVPAADGDASPSTGSQGFDARDLALWSSPALLASLGALVFAGGPAAPLLALAALAAPLAGCLLGGDPTGTRGAIERAVIIVGAALVMCAELVIAGDVALALGHGRLTGVATAAMIVGAATLMPRSGSPRNVALVAGALGLAVPVALVWMETATSPWRAWDRVASRSTVAFEDGSPPVTRGVTTRVPATLRFSEPQRITALTEGVYQVIERDGTRPVLREWRLAPGESLPVRAGDELTLAAGATIRFEPGKRVPGAPASGAAWADAHEPTPFGALAAFVGAVFTLGGTCAALGEHRPRPIAAVAASAAGVVALGAMVCWGVYAALAGLDLALGAPLVGTLVRAPAVLAQPGSHLSASMLIAGGAALLVAVGAALQSRTAQALALDTPAVALARLAWLAIVAAAAVGAALRPADGWRLFTLGAGLAAATLVAPRLVGAGTPRTIAMAVGVAAFAALTLGASALRDAAPVLAEFPALVAAPLAWAAGWLFDRGG
jgi:hypothetical protein